MAAGPVFNFILAFILSVIIVGFVGYDPAEIVEVQTGFCRSQKAGLEAGDVITEYNGYPCGSGEGSVCVQLSELTQGRRDSYT